MSRKILLANNFNYLSSDFLRLETIIKKKSTITPATCSMPAAVKPPTHQCITEVTEGKTSTGEDMMDDQVKDKGKGKPPCITTERQGHVYISSTNPSTVCLLKQLYPLKQ